MSILSEKYFRTFCDWNSFKQLQIFWTSSKKKELQKCTTSCSYNTNEQMSPLCVIFTGLLWVGVQVKEISVDNFQYEF